MVETRELLEKKAELTKWLARLEEEKNTVKPTIYSKVKGDYEERLRGVEADLKGVRREDIEKELETVDTQKDLLQSELEELILRHDIGEVIEGFQELKEKNEKEIEALGAITSILSKLLKEKPVEEELGRLIGELEEVVPELKAPPEVGVVEEEELKEKGLVCKKCGTLNRSDSWYCEKCGAELQEGGPPGSSG